MSECPRPLIVAGFQCKAPLASIGAAVEAPPIARLTGPTPDRMKPCCATTGKALSKKAARANVTRLEKEGRREYMARASGSGESNSDGRMGYFGICAGNLDRFSGFSGG